MITFYGDTVNPNLNDPNIWNHYLCQHIDRPGPNQNFTGQPQLDSAIFKYFKEPVKIATFNEYSPGKNVVIIGLHGGWNQLKLPMIHDWFTNNPHRLRAWQDPACQIVLDYCEEGFTTEVFEDVWEWIEQYNLQDRVLYVSSSCNVDALYKEWCMSRRWRPNMRCAWYGFFTNWITREKRLHNRTDLPTASYKSGDRRYMNLNRRPWTHRILLLTLLQHYKLIPRGAVSMPRHFDEAEIHWNPEDFDIPLRWDTLKESYNGYIDHLQPSFDQMYSQLPLVADKHDFSVNYALELNEAYYAQFPINVVTETLFFSAATFTSEKIWKPMLLGQIFMPMAAPLYLASLRELGFKTFAPYVDEDYDLIFDPIERATALVESLSKLINLPEPEFQRVLELCRPVLEHNRRLLLEKDHLNQLISTRVAESIESSWDL
jgi:hypothetical protein